MGKTWVLDTETKGTGAHVAPLKQAAGRGSSEQELSLVRFTPPARAPQPLAAPQPRPPRRFKVIDVMASRVLAEDVVASVAVAALERMRSVLDVRVYVWDEPTARWRLLTLAETRALWEFRGAGALAA